MDKDVYMRKQAKANKNSSQFDSEITRFRGQQSDIYSETSTHVINFVRVDCNVLKDALVGHCLQCQVKNLYTYLLIFSRLTLQAYTYFSNKINLHFIHL
jgi:hypothetical protein